MIIFKCFKNCRKFKGKQMLGGFFLCFKNKYVKITFPKKEKNCHNFYYEENVSKNGVEIFKN